MRYQSKKVAMVLLIVIMVTFLTSAAAYADDPGSAALPSVSELFEGQNDNKYLSVYKDNYYLDIEEVGLLGDHTGEAINGLANVFFKLQMLVGYLMVSIFYYAFEIDIYEIFSPVLDTFIKEMKTALFDEIAIFCIGLLGLFFVVMLVRDQKTQVWVAILETTCIVAIAIYFFTNPSHFMKQIDNGSKFFSGKVLTGTYKATNGGATPRSASIAAANSIWQIFVHEPWQILEFGNMQLAKQHEDRILSMPPASEERKAYIKDLAKDKQHFTPDWGGKRLGLMLLYFIPLTIMTVIIIILCLLMLGYKFLVIFFALLGVFVFILALIPFIGFRIIQSWGAKIIGFAGVEVIVCFCVGILMAFITTLFTLTSRYGWFITLVLQVVMVAMIYWKKDALFEAFTTMRLAPQNASTLNKQLRKDTNIEAKLRDYSRYLAFRRGYSGEDEEDDESGSNGSREYFGGRSLAGSKSYVPQIEAPSANHAAHHDMFDSHNGDRDRGYENESFKQLMKRAEDVLEMQYETLKNEAEQKSQQTGRAPEYSSFVTKVDTREQLGAQRFDQREIIAVAQELQRVVQSGGRPEDLYSREGHTKDTEVQAPKSVIELMINGQQTTVDREEAYKVVVEDNAKNYSEEFNNEYGRNYDPKFMEELIKKYGQYQVREILDRMKDIQKKEGSIKNPAGYLTQSLKNNARDKVNMRSNSGDEA